MMSQFEEASLVIGAAFLNFAIGVVWQMAFAKQWRRAWNISEIDSHKHDTESHMISFISSLWVSYGLFVLIKHIHPNGLIEVLFMGIGLWLLVVVGISGKHYSYANKSIKAFLIDYTLDLVGIVIMCLVIAEY